MSVKGYGASCEPVTIESFSLTDGAEEDLQRVIAKQPVAVYIDWIPALATYTGGILDYDSFPMSENRKHAGKHRVLVVVYDTDERGVQYWLLKNSHGRK